MNVNQNSSKATLLPNQCLFKDELPINIISPSSVGQIEKLNGPHMAPGPSFAFPATNEQFCCVESRIIVCRIITA